MQFSDSDGGPSIRHAVTRGQTPDLLYHLLLRRLCSGSPRRGGANESNGTDGTNGSITPSEGWHLEEEASALVLHQP